MNILFIQPHYIPAFSCGGIVYATQFQAECLSKSDHNVTILTTDVLDLNNRINCLHEYINGVEVVRFRNFHNHFARQFNFYNGFGVKKWAVDNIHKYDVVHISDVFSYFFIKPILELCLEYDIPYLLQTHGMLIKSNFDSNRLLKIPKAIIIKMLRPYYLKAGAYISVSDIETDSLLEYFDKDKIVKITNGIKIQRGLIKIDKSGKIKLCTLGRLSYVKGIERAIKLVVELYKHNPELEYLIYGPAERFYDVKLQNLINSLGAESYIKLMGPVYEDKKFQTLSEMDLFLMSSYGEAQPIAVIESISVETPVLASNEAYLSEYEGYKCVRKIDYDKPDIRELLSLIEDRRNISSMADDCHKLLEDKYDESVLINRLEELYKKVIMNNKPVKK
ncbi:glycosyltransferase family 4 protein [Candidatus Kapaibacterium sp.]